MSKETTTIQPAAAPLLRLLLSPFDMLLELDPALGAVRSLSHKSGKYFAPLQEGGYDDLIAYSADYTVHPEDRAAFLASSERASFLERLEQSETPGELHFSCRRKLLDGGWRRTERICITGERFGLPEGIIYAFFYDEEGGPRADADEEEEEDRRRSELTGLLRGEAFFERARALLQEHPSGWGILAFDIEHFKLFNDWFGRKQGDLLLARIGALLRRSEELTGGLAGYFGQDDFALLSPCRFDLFDQLYDDVHSLVIEHGTSVGFMPAFGICPWDGEGSAEELYDRAVVAARHAKEGYHTRIRFFDPSMYAKTNQDYRILSDFQKALKDHELSVQLQPQCLIENKKIMGAESLVRWHKADGTSIPPSVFVPILEQYGFVTDLDQYVWEGVCAWQKRWIDAGHTPLPVSVNVSQIDIFTIDVPEYLEQLIKKYELPTDVIKVEITESAYVDDAGIVDTVRRLREKGFLVLMDDFGSGYSSLNMLRSLNVDVIKLDAKFLRMNKNDKKGVQIVESIVNMAKTMGVPIIAEGVETQDETAFLSGLGCRYVQGYHFYRPMPMEDFEALIGEAENIDTCGFRANGHEQFRIREFLDRNVFSDAMLNNILGPVAFFLWHGSELDIVRFNQQFRDELQIAHFRDYLNRCERLVAPEERSRLFNLLRQALVSPLSGSSGEIRINRPDSSSLQLHLRFYFLEENEKGKKFYCSVRDVTQLMKLSEHMRLLSRLSSDSVIFLFQKENVWSAQVATNGLEDYLGLERDALESELNSRSFFERIPMEEHEPLRRSILDFALKTGDYSIPFTVLAPAGRVTLRVRFGEAREGGGGAKYIVVLHKG